MRPGFLRHAARAVLVLALLAVLVLAAGAAWLGSPHALDWAGREAMQRSDGRLVLERVEGSLLREVRIGRLSLDVEGAAVEAEALVLRWRPFALLRGVLHVEQATASRLAITRKAAAASPPPTGLAPPLRVVVAELAVARIDVDAERAVDKLRLRYQADRYSHAIALQSFEAAGWKVAGDVRLGAEAPFAASGSLRLLGVVRGMPVESGLKIAGSLDALDLTATASVNAATISAAARVRPFAGLPLDALSLQAEGIDLGAWDRRLPGTRASVHLKARSEAGGTLRGTLHAINAEPGPLDRGHLPLVEAGVDFVGGGGRWTFSGLDLRPAGAGRISGSGALNAGAMALDLALEGIDPSLLHGSLRAASLSGRAAVSGDAASQRVEAALEAAGMRLRIDARRAGEVVQIASARLRIGDGSIDFSGRMALAGARAFALEGSFSQLDPSRLLQSPAARLNGTLSATGELLPAWQAQVQLALADSTLRGLPLSARARFTSSAARRFDGEASAAIGRNRANLSGRHGQPEDRLVWTLDADALRDLDPALTGSIMARGWFTGTTDRFAFEFSATGAGVATPHGRIDALRLEGSGTRARHSLAATLRARDLDATLRANGGLDADWRWAGTLGELQSQGRWPLRLSAPATLAFDQGLAVVEQLNLAALGGKVGPASLRAEAGRITTQGAFRGLAAGSLLAADAPIDLRTLRVGGNWNLVLADTISGSVVAQREAGDISVKTDTPIAMRLRQLALSVAADDNAITLVAEVDSEAVGSASVRLQSRVERRSGQWLLPREAPVSGELLLDVRTLAWARALAPELDRVVGRLQGEARLAGTIADPRVTGHLNGDGLSARALGPGLDLRDGRLRAVFDDRVLKLTEFRIGAGDGSITAEGRADIAGGLHGMDISARAERARILASPQLTVVVSGTGRAGLRERQLALEGALRIDEGRYDLGSERRPALGDDVIVLDAGMKQPAKPSPLRVRLDVAIDLNDRFAVRGHGLDALLGGQLRVTTRGDALSALGTVRTLRGEYAAFGQTLALERGVLSFSGPLGNPALGLRALRRIQAVQVGVEVGGSLLRPAVKLVSTPDMPDSDRLAWLVLGRDPRSASRAELALLQAAALGVASRQGAPLQKQLAEGLGLDELGLASGSDGALGALAMGKRITSQLSVRLEQSLGGTAGSLLKIEYLLSERWRLRGTTGAENAGDILFTLRFD